MALRGIQEYITRDDNNIARVEDEDNIVSIEGNIFLTIPPPNILPTPKIQDYKNNDI